MFACKYAARDKAKAQLLHLLCLYQGMRQQVRVLKVLNAPAALHDTCLLAGMQQATRWGRGC